MPRLDLDLNVCLWVTCALGLSEGLIRALHLYHTTVQFSECIANNMVRSSVKLQQLVCGLSGKLSSQLPKVGSLFSIKQFSGFRS